MKALVKDTPVPNAMHIATMERPEVRADSLLLKVEAVGICGTDLSLYAWHQEIVDLYHPPLPLIMGHEFSGRIVDTGSDVRRFDTGQLVAVNPIQHCGRCFYCQRGNTNICDHRIMLGAQKPGAFVEYIIVPEDQAIALPEQIGGDVAALCEPLCVALHALERIPVADQVIAIAGAGPIGLLIAIVAMSEGAKRCFVTGLPQDAARLELAQKLGAHAISLAQQNPLMVVRAETQGHGADVVFETAGHPSAVDQAISIARKGAKIGLLGLPHESTSIATSTVAAQEKELIGIRAYTPATWQHCQSIIPGIAGQLSQLITHRFAFEDFEKAFRAALSKEGIKVLLRPAYD
jgi:2-desacetyl-2-hydroxyethyl bacteriochlorophyllide A dehydrogenase